MSKRIIISPYSQKMRNGKENPKNFDGWDSVVKLLKEKNWFITQIGIDGEKEIDGVDEFKLNMKLKDIEEMIKQYDTWCSVDNFFNHLASCNTDHRGVVIFGKSDPQLFGYSSNINLLKNRSFLRIKPWDIWEAEIFDENVFVSPQEVVDAIIRVVEK
jgi:hypothetical protein